MTPTSVLETYWRFAAERPRRWDRGAWLLVGGALAALALADVTGLSKGEVERIWLPFMPWIVTVTVVCVTGGGAAACPPPDASEWAP